MSLNPCQRSQSMKKCIKSYSSLFLCRSICEDPPDAKRQEAEEEEDDNQEEHPQPLLQRVV